MTTSIIIPARYGSSRYRGKPLVKILGREMVLRVADICKKIKNVKVFIATDSKKIANVAKKNGYDYIFTSSACLTGTDRVAEASKKIRSKIYINVQGDEPTIDPSDIMKVINAKKKFPHHVICGYDKVHDFEKAESPNLPKVVVNSKGELIYISRALVPGSKKKNQKIQYHKQVCIYAFNKKQLEKFYSTKKKSDTESIEDIEILRFFDLGEKIKMIKLNSNSVAVDEISDVNKAEKILRKNLKSSKIIKEIK
jgi:3-deoxy-manno-octulosonate cytidylyltransferase (CMP-KDO synthetase)